jgi:hypothetical protein
LRKFLVHIIVLFFNLDRRNFEPTKTTLSIKKPIQLSKSPNRQTSSYKINVSDKNSFKKLNLNVNTDLKKMLNTNAIKSSRTINLYQSNTSKKIKK